MYARNYTCGPTRLPGKVALCFTLSSWRIADQLRRRHPGVEGEPQRENDETGSGLDLPDMDSGTLQPTIATPTTESEPVQNTEAPGEVQDADPSPTVTEEVRSEVHPVSNTTQASHSSEQPKGQPDPIPAPPSRIPILLVLVYLQLWNNNFGTCASLSLVKTSQTS